MRWHRWNGQRDGAPARRGEASARRLGRAVTAGALAAVLTVSVTACTKKNPEGGGSGDQLQVAFVPKVEGIPYFEAMNTGAKEAAPELGVDWKYKGPSTADPGAQTEIVKSFIQQGVDVLVVAPNDPDSMAPIIEQAKNKGIHVMTSDTDAPDSQREVFVNQVTADAFGAAIMDNLAKAMGGKGKYAIVSCGRTASNLNSWIAAQKKTAAEKYPDMELVSTVYAGEDQAKATTMAKELMNANPDLRGLVGQCTSSAPGVAKAVKEAGKIGKVFTVGAGTPATMKRYLEDGSSSASLLWDVESLGELTVWAGKQLAEDKKFSAENKVSKDIPAATWTPETKTLLLGDPLTITAENAGDYDY